MDETITVATLIAEAKDIATQGRLLRDKVLTLQRHANSILHSSIVRTNNMRAMDYNCSRLSNMARVMHEDWQATLGEPVDAETVG